MVSLIHYCTSLRLSFTDDVLATNIRESTSSSSVSKCVFGLPCLVWLILSSNTNFNKCCRFLGWRFCAGIGTCGINLRNWPEPWQLIFNKHLRGIVWVNAIENIESAILKLYFWRFLEFWRAYRRFLYDIISRLVLNFSVIWFCILL